MSRKTPAREHPSPASQNPSAEGPPLLWSMDGLAAAWMGQPWMNLWMQAWAAWLEQLSALGSAPQAGAASADERRHAEFPWLPQFESTVIPLRRRDDEPGAEAAKVSMRVRVPAFPWATRPANIIAIDAMMPRSAGTSGDLPPTRH